MSKVTGLWLCLGVGMAVTAFPMDAQEVARLEMAGRYEEALALCRKAGESGETLYTQGDYYFHGRKGVPQDEEEEQGNDAGQDMEKALFYLQEAVNQGYSDAREHLERLKAEKAKNEKNAD